MSGTPSKARFCVEIYFALAKIIPLVSAPSAKASLLTLFGVTGIANKGRGEGKRKGEISLFLARGWDWEGRGTAARSSEQSAKKRGGVERDQHRSFSSSPLFLRRWVCREEKEARNRRSEEEDQVLL